jgi:hypothetical protein
MTALIGYIVVTLVTGAIVARFTGWRRPPGPARPTLELADTARKVEAVLSGLAGFAFTSVVLLITLSGSRLDPHAERTIELIALLVVAYLGFVVGAIMYAHTEPLTTPSGIDLLPAQHAVASAQFYRSIMSGWLALAPLVAIVGSQLLTTFVLGLLFLAIFGAWTFHAGDLASVGYAEPRFLVLVPLTGFVGAFGFAALLYFAPQLRSPDSVLYLVAAGATLGASAHFAFHAARAVGADLPDVVVRSLRAIIAADSHASAVLMTFLWLAVAGFI